MVVGWVIETGVWLYDSYLWTLTFADPRVEKWLFMDSPWWTFWLSLAYLSMVVIGPLIMDFLPPLRLRPLLVLFNLGLTLLNFYIFLELLIVSWKADYSYRCQPVVFSRDPLELRIAAALWWFYFSKFLEFADTLFFILRKKYSQLTFLHVYHHVTMFCFWWIGIKWVAGGSSFLGALMNSFVHTIMYFYYGYTAACPNANVWWKKYLTVLQLIQFLIAIVQTGIGLYIDCPFPRWMGYTLIAYMTSFIILFANFWIHAYATRRAKKQTPKLSEAEIKRRKKVLLRALNSDPDHEIQNGFIDQERTREKLDKPLRRRSNRLKKSQQNEGMERISEDNSS